MPKMECRLLTASSSPPYVTVFSSLKQRLSSVKSLREESWTFEKNRDCAWVRLVAKVFTSLRFGTQSYKTKMSNEIVNKCATPLLYIV